LGRAKRGGEAKPGVDGREEEEEEEDRLRPPRLLPPLLARALVGRLAAPPFCVALAGVMAPRLPRLDLPPLGEGRRAAPFVWLGCPAAAAALPPDPAAPAPAPPPPPPPGVRAAAVVVGAVVAGLRKFIPTRTLVLAALQLAPPVPPVPEVPEVLADDRERRHR